MKHVYLHLYMNFILYVIELLFLPLCFNKFWHLIPLQWTFSLKKRIKEQYEYTCMNINIKYMCENIVSFSCF